MMQCTVCGQTSNPFPLMLMESVAAEKVIIMKKDKEGNDISLARQKCSLRCNSSQRMRLCLFCPLDKSLINQSRTLYGPYTTVILTHSASLSYIQI